MDSAPDEMYPNFFVIVHLTGRDGDLYAEVNALEIL